MGRLITLCGLAILVFQVPHAAEAEVPSNQIEYSKAVSLKRKTYTFRFSLWDSAKEGAMLWSEQKKIKLTSKTLTHTLGSVDPGLNPISPELFDLQLWVQLDKQVKAGWSPVGIRTKFTAYPYALKCSSVLDGAITNANIGEQISAGKISSDIARSSDLATHTGRLDNPHQVTAAQAGAAPAAHNHDAAYLRTNAAAGGDISGAFSDLTISKLKGNALSGAAPILDQILKWNGTQWAPAEDADSGGDITAVTAGPDLSGGASSGAATLSVVFGGTGSAPTVARSDHTHAYASYAKTVIVSPVGTAAQNGAALLSALSGITGASANNPYLLKIEPGVYNIGSSSSLAMKPYVDIEGSGEDVTKITRSGFGTDSGTVEGEDNAEIRFLTIENTGGLSRAIAFYSDGKATKLTHVTLQASNDADIFGGLFSNASSPRLTNVTASASGGTTSAYGLYFLDSEAPVLKDVEVTVTGGSTNYGIFSDDGTPVFRDIKVTVDNGSVQNRGIHIQTATLATVENATVEISHGSTGYGCFFSGISSLSLRNLYSKVTGSAGTSYGGNMNNVDSFDIRNAGFIARSGVNTYGLYVNNSSGVIDQSNIFAASGSGNNYGLYFPGSAAAETVSVNHSRLSGTTRCLAGGANNSVYVAVSQMAGGNSSAPGGTLMCIGAYDENYTTSGYTSCL